MAACGDMVFRCGHVPQQWGSREAVEDGLGGPRGSNNKLREQSNNVQPLATSYFTLLGDRSIGFGRRWPPGMPTACSTRRTTRPQVRLTL